jgi:hypothetical protein
MYRNVQSRQGSACGHRCNFSGRRGSINEMRLSIKGQNHFFRYQFTPILSHSYNMTKNGNGINSKAGRIYESRKSLQSKIGFFNCAIPFFGDFAIFFIPFFGDTG